ncbi:MAG: FimV/HubP family polar landmark protein [Casimicrobiaceae bacterium]
MRAKSIHTLSLLASAIAMALPPGAAALGLGKLTVQSSLGQPLSAEIELTSAARDELESLAARIADPALYRQNNLTYQGVLSRARVALERNQSGQAVLKVSTPTPVNEPYLDLMVELNWASGRVVRGYTFLLDPPGIAAPAPAVDPVTPARAGNAAAGAARAAAPAPVAGSTASAAGSGGTTPPAAAAGARRGSASNRPGNTYAVRRGDSLTSIANQLRPESVSLEQMLVALYKANPGAFDGDNMNRLRSGSILTVPPAPELNATSTPDATRVVRAQASDWRSYRDRVAAGAPVTDSTGSRATGGQITTQVQERTPAAQPGRDQVRVSRDAGPGKGTGAGAGAAEDAVARDRALQDARTRIAELEKALNDLKRALEMRNPAMAQLQNQTQAGKGTPTEAPKSGAPAATAAATGAAASRATDATPPAATKGPEAPTASTVTPAPAPSVATAPAAVPTPAPAPATAVTPDAGKSTPKPAKVEPAGPSMIDDVIANTPGWAFGAGAIALLAAIVAFFAARRRKTANFEDSIISGTDIKTNTVFGSTGGGIVNTGENSLSSDFSREGMSTIDTDEVDPIAEAEVYLAYGRDAQAEEILKDALKKDPQRQEVYLKVLEIHAQHNKPAAFEAVAAELYAVSHGQGETWQKAAALGRQLDANNPMFTGDGAAAAAAVGAAGAAIAMGAARAATPEPRPAEVPRASEAAAVPTNLAGFPHDDGMDFKLDDDISITPGSAPGRKPVDDLLATDAAGSSGLGFTGQPAGESRPPDRAMSIEERIDAAHAADPKYDLDFQLDDIDRSPPTRSRGAEAMEASSQSVASQMRPQAAIELDKLDLSFDPERTTFEDPTPSVLDGQWHDAATKLDLAKAYQEMGDVEGAREILQEVLHEGDEQQKSEAGALLGKLV